ncbi:MAG: BatA domain-containing protein, partial [Planctomycetota bacterium]|nr:BatA domain-containing protein [Planctomycetota bacterium]MDI6787529.1 BatA domain-containing protein [Planctomycetota bacterium]
MPEIGFDNPLGLMALLLIPPVILLHRFRQRPVSYNISSLFIWNEIKQYLVISKPLINKSRQYLILILQILSIILLSFALSRLTLVHTITKPLHLVFLIDNSASLGSIYQQESQSQPLSPQQTRSEPFGNTHGKLSESVRRWDLLIQEIATIIKTSPADTFVSFYQSFQDGRLIALSRSEALSSIKQMTLKDIPSALEEFSSIIRNVRGGGNGDIYFCSDKLPLQSLFPSGAGQRPRLILYGQPSDNKAIIHVSAVPLTPTESAPTSYGVLVSIRDYSVFPSGGGGKEDAVMVRLHGIFNKKDGGWDEKTLAT